MSENQGWVRQGSSKDERKVNASTVQSGDRVVIKVYESGEVGPSRTKTGEGVIVTTVTNKIKSAGRRGYVIVTGQGSFYAEPIQTMWKAQEDAAGIKRAHAEALTEDLAYEIQAEAEREDAERIGGVEDLTLNSHGGKVDNNSEDEPEGDEMTATTTETVSAKKHTGSAVVALLERVWDRIRENHPELPQAVIVTGMGADIGGLKWGHFRADGWEVVQAEGAALRMNEMFMAGETLAKGALQVLQTMLHEGAHTLARVREIQDTSRQHRWHNAKFRTLAEEMGLGYPGDKADPKIGFSAVTLTEETKAEYADLIAELDKEISLVISLPGWLGGLGGLLGGLGGDPLGGDGIKGRPTEPTGNTSTNLKLTCECEEPNIIRASRKVAEKLVVRCSDCDTLFRER